MAAVFPIHYPRALLRAHNILPVEVWGPPHVDPAKGDAHLQSYTCSIVRHGLSFAMGKDINEVDLVLVPHCCDTLQGLGSILLDFLPPGKPVLPIYVPREQRPIDISFFADEIRALSAALERISGTVASPSALDAALSNEDNATSVTKDLYNNRRKLSLSDKEFYSLLRSREYTPAEQYITYVRNTLTSSGGKEQTGIPIFFSGVVPEPVELFDSLNNFGGFVVGDDFLSCGRRLYPGNASPDPFERMAKSILEGPPDSTRGSTFERRAEYFLDEIHRKQAKGVIFYHAKFCEPEQFYLPRLEQTLNERNIPFLSLEIDIGTPLSNQTITRMEAFMEMVA